MIHDTIYILLMDISNKRRCFTSDGWLAKYCILPPPLADAFAKTFEIVDEQERGWLSALDTVLALRAANTQLTDTQEEYIYRVSGVNQLMSNGSRKIKMSLSFFFFFFIWLYTYTSASNNGGVD